MAELRRNPQTGIVEVWKNGKMIGSVTTMGDKITSTEGDEIKERINQERRLIHERTCNNPEKKQA